MSSWKSMLMNRLVLVYAYEVLQEAVLQGPVQFSCREWFYVHKHPLTTAFCFALHSQYIL